MLTISIITVFLLVIALAFLLDLFFTVSEIKIDVKVLHNKIEQIEYNIEKINDRNQLSKGTNNYIYKEYERQQPIIIR